MLFHSYTFLYFLLATATLHELLPRAGRRYLLLAASLVFYGTWNYRYLALLLLTTVIDYLAGRWIDRADSPRRRRVLLVVSMASNLGILGLFKYYNFFAQSLRDYLELQLPLHELLLPVGISFYTFQSMSYTIDIYRREIRPARNFVEFLLFVTFFPQLVAGPIVRAHDFLPQLREHQERTPDSLRLGAKLFLLGLFRKVVVADNLAPFVDAVHRDPTAFSAGDLWVAAYAFAFQIYYDFAGYSDMAIGLALLFGFRFPENFRRPYLAGNVSEFWRRWHISLSTWLRDYLYIPLGGSRGGRGATAACLLVTMLLGGLWHGANWTFVVWGLIHGLALVLQRIWAAAARSLGWFAPWQASVAWRVLAVLLTFHVWTLSMVIFRSTSIAVAMDLLSKMFSRQFGGVTTGGATLGICALLYGLQVINERVNLLHAFDRLPLAIRSLAVAGTIWGLILLAPKQSEPFLYFQF